MRYYYTRNSGKASAFSDVKGKIIDLLLGVSLETDQSLTLRLKSKKWGKQSFDAKMEE